MAVDFVFFSAGCVVASPDVSLLGSLMMLLRVVSSYVVLTMAFVASLVVFALESVELIPFTSMSVEMLFVGFEVSSVCVVAKTFVVTLKIPFV